jgi:hypothetical protein
MNKVLSTRITVNSCINRRIYDCAVEWYIDNAYAEIERGASGDDARFPARLIELSQARRQRRSGGQGRVVGELRVAANHGSSSSASSSSMSMSVTLDKACANCGSRQARLKCSRCEMVRYCCKECQRAHWPQHRVECQPRSVAALQELLR